MDATLKAIARQNLNSTPGSPCRGASACTCVAHALCQACASFSPAELEQLFTAYYERAQQQGTAGAICLLGLLVCFGGRPELADVSGRQLLEIAQPHCPQAGVLLGLCCQLGLQGAPLEVRRGPSISNQQFQRTPLWPSQPPGAAASIPQQAALAACQHSFHVCS